MNIRQVLPRDAIPSVDEPTFRATHADPDEQLIALTGDDPRAYPIRYLHYHEIVNDVVAGRPVAVTWCPLCGSAVVYDRRVGDRTLTFGVSGKLADDDLVMYDRETDSEWKQSTGRAFEGPLSGSQLTVLPAAVTTWEQFSDAHPHGRILAPPGGTSEAASDDDTPAAISYDDNPYEAYFATDGFGLAAHRGDDPEREWPRDDIDPKTVVLGIEHGRQALGFPLPEVKAAGGVVTTSIAGQSVVVTATDDGIHAFASDGVAFTPTGDGMRGDGATWNPATGRSDDGRQLDRLPARRVFAFTWRDDHGDDAFWTNE